MAGRITDVAFGGGISTVSDRCWILHAHEADPPTLSRKSRQPSHRSLTNLPMRTTDSVSGPSAHEPSGAEFLADDGRVGGLL